jgi:16S rRNA A1518/A1519 N6-dimethyltransferase RsmA/KsgA/DIM1 with predicted DNA glycosylase/AP lyase activity
MLYRDNHFAEYIFSLINDDSFSDFNSVIELGAGMGRFTAPLIQNFSEITIVEPVTEYFDILKTKFTELITNTGIRKAFEDFDLQRSHQIIHNYRVGAVPADAKGICDNLIDLIEFMLQDENDLLNSIDLTKL